MRFRRILCCILLIITCCGVQAQVVPQWIKFPPAKTETYYYRVAQATALTEDSATRKAFAIALYESAMAIGVRVDLHKLEKMSEDSTTVVVSKFATIPINVVCKHVEKLITRRGYRAYVLCQVANDRLIMPKYKTFNCFLNKEE